MKQEVFEGEITPIFQTVIGTKYALEAFLGVSFFTREWKVLKKVITSIRKEIRAGATFQLKASLSFTVYVSA